MAFSPDGRTLAVNEQLERPRVGSRNGAGATRRGSGRAKRAELCLSADRKTLIGREDSRREFHWNLESGVESVRVGEPRPRECVEDRDPERRKSAQNIGSDSAMARTSEILSASQWPAHSKNSSPPSGSGINSPDPPKGTGSRVRFGFGNKIWTSEPGDGTVAGHDRGYLRSRRVSEFLLQPRRESG